MTARASGEAGAPGPAPVAIRVENASRAFANDRGKLVALSRVTLDVRDGELLCLVGPSGCGKSTLLNLMAGLELPDEGAVFMRGKRITGPGPDRAVMFQEHALFPWRTVSGNVAYPLERLGWPKERIAARVAELLKLVHLSKFGRSWVHQLSGGMRQRVALARALASDPGVLLMDEPFAALDAQTRDVLLGEMQRLHESARKTIVFVTHNVREAVVLGTRIALMSTGPGRIDRIEEVDLPRPRSIEDHDVAALAARIKQHLKVEIDRVLREELGDDYVAPEGRRNRPPAGPLGSGG